jgi:hypothetical protein
MSSDGNPNGVVRADSGQVAEDGLLYGPDQCDETENNHMN